MNKILLLGKRSSTNSSIAHTLSQHPEWKMAIIDYINSVDKAVLELSVTDVMVIIIDCSSIDESPLEILIRIKAAAKKIPIVLLNKPGMEKTAIQCMVHGADYYILKEQKWQDELIPVLEFVLDNRNRNNALQKRVNYLSEENQHLKTQMTMDSKTMFYSFSHFQNLIEKELSRARRHQLQLSCLMVVYEKGDDKEINETELSLILRNVFRNTDIWGKVKENCYAVLMPHTDAKQAKLVQSRISKEIDASPLNLKVKYKVSQLDRLKTPHTFFEELN